MYNTNFISHMHNIRINLLGERVGKGVGFCVGGQRSGLQILGPIPPLLHTPRLEGLPLFGSH